MIYYSLKPSKIDTHERLENLEKSLTTYVTSKR